MKAARAVIAGRPATLAVRPQKSTTSRCRCSRLLREYQLGINVDAGRARGGLMKL